MRQIKFLLAYSAILILLISGTNSNKMAETIDKATAKQYPMYQPAWSSTNFQGLDIGIGPDGDAIAVGIDGKVYNYNFIANSWSQLDGDYEMLNIIRVDVDDQGTPYLVGSVGGIFYLSCYNNWVQLPGCAVDIGVGRGSEIWRIGCDAKGPNRQDFGVWKLFCECECKCGCERRCIRFRPSKYLNNPNGDKRKCYWNKIEGAGIRIDVHPNGNPYIINNSGRIFKYDSESYNFTPVNGLLAKDLTLSNDGLLYAVGKGDNRIYRAVDEDAGTWQALQGCANEVSSGPYSQPWIIACDSNVVTTSKLNFN